jgi:hypothetical protein
MKTHSKILALLLAAGACTAARAGLFSDSFETIVVAERAKDAPPAQDGGVACALVDGGYIEAGDPIAGDEPPSAASVRQELQDALGQAGFHAGAPAPSVLLSYYWGVLRVDHLAARLPYGINANLDARIRLVSTEALGSEVENHILGAKKGGGETMTESSPPILIGPLETIVENARKPRYFVVVSAYQYQAAGDRGQPRLLWRAKLSAQETSGGMDEVIPALIARGASYFGKDMQNATIVPNTLMKSVSPAPGAPTQLADDDTPSPEFAALVRREHTAIAGQGDGKG